MGSLLADLGVVSPPSRGAWIEIIRNVNKWKSAIRRPPRGGRGLKSAVRTGCASGSASRPPRGGRGLKYQQRGTRDPRQRVAPLAGGVD